MDIVALVAKQVGGLSGAVPCARTHGHVLQGSYKVMCMAAAPVQFMQNRFLAFAFGATTHYTGKVGAARFRGTIWIVPPVCGGVGGASVVCVCSEARLQASAHLCSHEDMHHQHVAHMHEAMHLQCRGGEVKVPPHAHACTAVATPADAAWQAAMGRVLAPSRGGKGGAPLACARGLLPSGKAHASVHRPHAARPAPHRPRHARPSLPRRPSCRAVPSAPQHANSLQPHRPYMPHI